MILAPPPHPKVLVCWSGGCDSTLLLYHVAKQYGTAGSPVRAFALDSDSHLTAGRKEAQARKRILRELRKRGLNIELTEMSLTATAGSGLSDHGLPQAVMWLLASQALTDQETLAMGYVKGDDWLANIEHFQTVFNKLQTIAGRTGTLWLPLMFTEKRGVLHQLREMDLLELTWWCGAPDGRKKTQAPCGKCASCETHATALWKLGKFGPGHAWRGGTDGA